jgi:LmbE family N-acetylglucosaminyl deacetylase
MHRSIVAGVADVAGAEASEPALHALWRLRCAEDREAMAVLGCESLHLDFADAIFRPEIESWSQIWGREQAASHGLSLQLAERLIDLWQRCGRPLLYAPLAVGSHLDHVVCFDAAAQAAIAGARVRYYEELPYVLRPFALEARLAALGHGWQPQCIDITAYMPKRIAAAGCYRSQIRGSFGAADRVGPLFWQLAALRGGSMDRACERVWHREPKTPESGQAMERS